uniref:TPR_REGION domain-containing protein n=1 Tax=Elaeophora elaphi TaxID=1147741 RepID=A0A0R3RGA9_9BILA
MAETSKTGDSKDLVAPFDSSAKDDVADISAKMEDNGIDDIVHKALNDDTQNEDNKGTDMENEIISNQDSKETDEKKKKEELEKRREREAALSEEELNNLREQSKTLKTQGNDYFGQGFWYEAAHFYTKSLDICPLTYTCDRATYLSNRAAAHMKLRDWEKAIEDCSEALEIGAPNDKPLERRAYCYAQLEEKYEQAIEDYESLQKMHPERRSDYVKKIADLKRAIEERNERMKREMISKLKDFGNMCLKPFGLSTDNFEMVQQPGGGYSISMKKK